MRTEDEPNGFVEEWKALSGQLRDVMLKVAEEVRKGDRSRKDLSECMA